MEVLLDSSFIISCVRKKIDFLVQLSEQGFKVLLPHEVFEELKDLRKKSSLSHEDRMAIDVAMEIFEKRKVKMMRLGSGLVDEGLIRKGKDGYYIASLDGSVKHNVPRRVIIDTAGNKVMAEMS